MAPKRKRQSQTLKKDPSPSKQPKLEQSTPKQERPASSPPPPPYSKKKKAKVAHKKEVPVPPVHSPEKTVNKEQKEMEHKLRAVEGRVYEHLQRRRERAERGETDRAEEEEVRQELHAMSRQLEEHMQLHEQRRREIRRKRREEMDRAERARQKKAKEEQVRVLREKREKSRNKHYPRRGFRVNVEVEVPREKSRVGEMLRIEKDLENSKILRARAVRQKKRQKWSISRRMV
ncbi:hypothetical protein CPB85DRAFT_1276510 [Mucidula mucida]|nr:hypothetical protein CPB85DRAFT_1276510 [Mucidula mucida]